MSIEVIHCMIVHPPGYEIGLAIADLMQNKVIKQNQLKIAYSLFSLIIMY